jgi:hypothetical protein
MTCYIGPEAGRGFLSVNLHLCDECRDKTTIYIKYLGCHEKVLFVIIIRIIILLKTSCLEFSKM